LLQAIEYCNIIDAKPSASPVPPPGCDPDVWDDSVISGRPADPDFDKVFTDSKEEVYQV
jgi:hypothetical protein